MFSGRRVRRGTNRLAGNIARWRLQPVPYRKLAANELGAFLGAISQPRRIQIIEELRSGEKDVGTLASTLELTHSNVSQHLAVLRTLRIVAERRVGRRVVYHICSPQLAEWLALGLQFVPAMNQATDQVKNALQCARDAWVPKSNGSDSDVSRGQKDGEE